VISLSLTAKPANNFFAWVIGLVLILLTQLNCLDLAFADRSQAQTNPHIYFKQGVTQVQKGEYLLAIANFTEAISANPKFAAAYSNRCYAYLQIDSYDRAILDCSKAIGFGAHESALLNRGIAYYRQASFTQAIADFSQAIRDNHECAEAYLNRGIAYLDQGNLAKSLTDLEQAADCFLAKQDLSNYEFVIDKIVKIQKGYKAIV
jgi:tetratricopeptide (TPR) repeat protein